MIGVFLALLFYKFDGYSFMKYELFGYKTQIPAEFYTCFDMLDKMLGDKRKEEFKNTRESDISLFMLGYLGYPWETQPGQNEPEPDMKKVFSKLGLKSTELGLKSDLNNIDGKNDLSRVNSALLRTASSADSFAISRIILKAYHRDLNHKDTRLMDEIKNQNDNLGHAIKSEMLSAMTILSIIQFITCFFSIYIVRESL
jgi:hypothetical protein